MAKKGLYHNINKRKKEGKAPLKPSSENYPTDKAFADSAKTAKEEYTAEGKMETARKNVGADKCWDGYKAKGTKKKDGKVVPNCVKEGKTFQQFCAEAAERVSEEYKELPKRKMGMKAGKKVMSALGHAAKAGAEGEGTIEAQVRTQKAEKKGKQATKMHDTAGSHNETLSRAKSLKNKLKGVTKRAKK